MAEVDSERSNSPQREIAKKKSRTWSLWNSADDKETQKVFDEPTQVVDQNDSARTIESTHQKSNSLSWIWGTDRRDSAPLSIPESPNIVVPCMDNCLPSQSVINKLWNLAAGNSGASRHLSKRGYPKRFKKALIIGVHGFFPNKYLRALIGEPTGTSIKFAIEAEKSVLKWAQDQNLDISIQKIALEREGKVLDRVGFFTEVMEKWCHDLERADFIFFAAHSQGVPVSIILLSRLIAQGIIKNPEKKCIGVLAMAGVNNGPFYGIDQKLLIKAYSKIENESMWELFGFQNAQSIQSKEYLSSIKLVISKNVKIVYVGSIDDQLVPLYSAIASHVHHPHIYRAVYIDGYSNTPDFVSRVVKIACCLKNLGFSDHGIIREISASLCGPLTGGGHSKVYNDPQVYGLALQFILGTTDSPANPVGVTHFQVAELGSNPFHLPWCMRGLVFETKRHYPAGGGADEIEKVFEEFDCWRPESKVLKDMKYRLNAMKSKL